MNNSGCGSGLTISDKESNKSRKKVMLLRLELLVSHPAAPGESVLWIVATSLLFPLTQTLHFCSELCCVTPGMAEKAKQTANISTETEIRR